MWVIKNGVVTGMIDQLFYNEKSQKLEIWDWKTNKAINNSNKWQQFKEPLNSFRCL